MGVFKRWVSSKDGTKTPYWYIRYTVNGKDKWEGVGKAGQITKTVAQQRLEERKRQVRLGQLDMIDVKIPTLSEFAEDYMAHVKDVVQKRSWKRDKVSLQNLNLFFGNRKLSEITPGDVDDYKRVRLSSVKPATVDRELAVLSHLFNLAERWKKFFGKNPVSVSGLLHPNSQVERILTLEEEERLLKCCNLYLRPIVVTALNTGMRKMEILSLKWSSVDSTNNVIILEHTNTKSKKTRRVPLNATMRTLLLEQRIKTQHSGYVFLNSLGNPFAQTNYIRFFWVKALKDAGIKGLRFHDLRHTFATRAIEAGASIVAVSRILGHADLKTTMRYAHPEDSLKDAVEKVENFGQRCSKSGSNENTL